MLIITIKPFCLLWSSRCLLSYTSHQLRHFFPQCSLHSWAIIVLQSSLGLFAPFLISLNIWASTLYHGWLASTIITSMEPCRGFLFTIAIIIILSLRMDVMVTPQYCSTMCTALLNQSAYTTLRTEGQWIKCLSVFKTQLSLNVLWSQCFMLDKVRLV